MMQDRKLLPIPTDEMTSSTPVNSVQNRWALLVGVDRYVDPAFSRLNFCVKDVLALNTILEQLGYTIACLHDKLDPRDVRFPTFSNVEAELTQLCQTVGSDDLLWVHFACHGTLIDKQPVLIAENTRHATLANTALPLAKIEALMRSSKAKRLVLTLDACHTGVEMGRELSDPAFIKNAYELAEGFALIAASTAQQVAQEWREVEHGVFTYYLLEGLTGKADHASKGFVSVQDLQTYVVNNLRKWNIRQGGRIQEPTFRADGIGDMILGDYRQYGKPSKAMKILIVASNPRQDLRLDRAIRDLLEVIKRSPNRKQLEVEVALAVRPGDLQGLLLRHSPRIVHFCGHGTGERGLVFQNYANDARREQVVSTDALSELFRLVSKTVECVLLNACYSEVQADAIVQHINYVIGMRQEIRDDAAIAFVTGFYQALGYEYPIELSYEFGCNAIQLAISGSSVSRSAIFEEQRKLEVVDVVEKTVIPEHLKPILKKKANPTRVNASKFA